MLFDRRSATQASAQCAPLLFADWEAVSFTPFMWDFTYCTTIGMSVAERRATQGVYLDYYLAALVKNGVPIEQCRADDARTDLLRMTLMLYQLRFLVPRGRFLAVVYCLLISHCMHSCCMHVL
jgi:hypothetical protein